MAQYHTRIACEVLGVWRDPKSPFELTDEQAELLKPPYGNVIIPVSAEVAQNIIPAPDAPDVKKELPDGRLNRS